MNGLVLLSAAIFGGLFLWTVAFDDAAGAAFAKYDGIDGESKDTENHDSWIDVLSVDWGVHKPGGGDTGQSRRRGSAVVEDVTLTFEYEKAAPKLLESALTGRVTPNLYIELTKGPLVCDIVQLSDGKICRPVGDQEVYLRYHMQNVLVSSYSVSGSNLDEGGPPTVVVSMNFEEVKVTYTEFGDDGSKNDVETTWKVEKGAK